MKLSSSNISSSITKNIIRAILFILALNFSATGSLAEDQNVKVGVFPFKPLIFTDSSGTTSGIYADLLNQIAKENDWNITYDEGTWNEGLEKAKSGDLDLITSVMYTAERDEFLDYTQEPFFVVWGEVYVLPDAGIANVLDLDGKKVALMEGDRNGDNFRKLIQDFDVQCEIIEVPTHDEVMTLVRNKSVSAGVAPNLFGFHHAIKYGLTHTIVFSPTPLYCAAPEGKNKTLLAEIDATLSRWKEDPGSFYHKTMKYWLSHEAAQKKIVPKWLVLSFISTIILILALVLWNKILNVKVNQRTRELAKSEERLSQITDNSLMWIWEVDKNGLYTYCSDTCEYILGFTANEIVGQKHFYDFFHPEEREHLKKVAFEDFNNKENFKDFENRNLNRMGESVWLSTSGVPLLDNEGQLLGYRGADIDITEKKRLMEEQSRSAQLSALGEIAAGVAHEINNPINGVINYTQLLINKDPEDGFTRGVLERIAKESQRVASIVQNLLGIAHKGSEKKEFITPKTLFEDPLNLLCQLMKNEGIKINNQLQEDLPEIYCNTRQIEQVILNLLSNARHALNEKYPKEDNNKCIIVEAKHLKKLNQLQIIIQDQGTGIPKDKLGRIFDPFFTTKKTGLGTGLGLSIAQDMIRKNSGDLTIESKFGEYTKVILTLPTIEK